MNAALVIYSSSKDHLKKGFWKNIHLARVVVLCGMNRKIINFPKASMPPRVHSSILPFLQIILVLIIVRRGIESIPYPQIVATTFAFSSV